MKIYSLFLCLVVLCGNLVSQTNVIGAKESRITEAEAVDESLFVEAYQKYLLADYEKAKVLAEKIVYAQERNDGAYFLLARTHMALKNYNDALIAIKKASALDPNNKWYYHLQGDIYEATARNKDAIGIYEGLLLKFPTAPLYYEKLSYLYTLGGEPVAALQVLDRWQKATGLTLDIADKRHLICIGMKNDQGAIQAYEDFARAYPTNTAPLHKLATYYRETNRTQEASAVYQRILAISPEDPEARIGAVTRTAVGASGGTDFLSALRPLLADPTIQIDSKIAKLLPFLKGMEQEKDSTRSALMQIAAKDLTATHVREAKAWSFAGDVYYLLGKNTEALEFYKRCLALQPSVFSVWQNTYEILNQQENYKELLTISEKGMDAFPNQPLSYYFFGLASNALGKANDALPQLQQALLMAGTKTALKLDIIAQTGLAHIKLGKPEQAITTLESALAKGGDKHPFVLEYLGDAYSAKGNTTKATEYWRAAQKIQNSPRLAKKLG